MAWNNRLEKNKFDKRQARLAAKYRAAGMTEEQIENLEIMEKTAVSSARNLYVLYPLLGY